MKRVVPVWLPDDVKSGVLTSWVPIANRINTDDIVFVTDAKEASKVFDARVITSEEFLNTRKIYTPPLLNLGTSLDYMKQLNFLKQDRAFVFFHQLFIHRLIENIFLRNGSRQLNSLVRYGEVECGMIGKLLAEIGSKNGLTFDEYYIRTFAIQVAQLSIGYCSAWKGAAELLAEESNSKEIKKKFIYLPPPFDASLAKYVVKKEAGDNVVKFALVGHKNLAKQPLFCMEIVRYLNELGLKSLLIGIGTIGDFLLEHAGPDDSYYFESVSAPEHGDFLSELAKCDFVFHFRSPFGGEMPLTVCEGMALGVPPIGFDFGWLLDLPKDIWVSIKEDMRAKEAAQTILTIVQNRKKITSIKKKLLRYVREHSCENYSVKAVKNIIGILRDWK